MPSWHCNGEISLVTQSLENNTLLFLKAEEVLYDHELILSSLFIPSTPCIPSITFLLPLIHSRGSVKLLLILLHINLPSFVSSHSHFPLCQKQGLHSPFLFTTAHVTCQDFRTTFRSHRYFYRSPRQTKNFSSICSCTPSLGRREEERGWSNQLSDNIKPCSPEVVISREFEVGGEGNCCQCVCHVFLQVGFFCIFSVLQFS